MIKQFKYYLMFIISFLGLEIFSFTQRDLNLTIYNQPLLLNIQSMLIKIGYYQRTLNSILYLLLIIIAWLAFFYIFKYKIWSQPIFKIFLASIFILGIFSYPAFSHDIFNYLFNVKMVLIYHLNPHIHTALEFPSDLWIRFMHNVHTAAPYGYLWTGLSILPLILTIKSFTLSFWAMKLFIIIFFVIEGYFIYKITNNFKNAFLFILNPLLFLETVIVGHNDSVMMAFALISWWGIDNFIKQKKIKWLFLTLITWIASIYIKYATVILIPFFLIKICQNFDCRFSKKLLNLIKKIDTEFWAGISFWLILFSRPGQLHSWYLHWGIAFLILSKHKLAKSLIILFSIGGVLRYLPFVYYGNWDYPVNLWRWVFLFLPFIIWLIIKKVINKDVVEI